MMIKADLGALKRTRWHEYLIRFAFGGMMTVATGWVANRFGPAVGGLLLAFPVIFPASATLVEKHELERKRRAGIPFTLRGRLAAALDARGAAMGALGLMTFAVVTWRLVLHCSLLATLASALGSWLTVSGALWYIRKHHPWARPTGIPT
ncbi:MAG TPA: hypothetical protein VMU40_12295 [Steroidobacteraceae bacterium]|nr:hypothetical protein [Steroidobacteraceae bacterium]